MKGINSSLLQKPANASFGVIMPFQPMVAMPVLAAAAAVKRKDIAPGFAGQGMGLIHKVKPAAEVMADLVKSAESSLSSANAYL